MTEHWNWAHWVMTLYLTLCVIGSVISHSLDDYGGLRAEGLMISSVVNAVWVICMIYILHVGGFW